MALKTKRLEQPGEELQRKLDDIMNDRAEVVAIPGTRKKYKVRWLKRGTMRKITSITLGKDNDKQSCKVCACILLNGFWSILFFYWIYWRWLYYIKQYDEDQLSPIIMVGKKKVPAMDYYKNIMLAIGMRDTIMSMTREEVELIHQEHHTEQPTP